jgi:hypothetical protein
MGNGLAALMGILKGAEGLPEGVAAGDRQRLAEQQANELTQHRVGQQRLAEQQLAETVRHRQAAETERQNARARDAQRDAALSSAFLKHGTQTETGPAPEAAMYSEAPPSRTTTTVDPGMKFLSEVVLGMGHEKAAPLVVEHMKERAGAGGGAVTPHFLQDGTQVVLSDKKGNVGAPRPTGLQRTDPAHVQRQARIERALAHEGWVPGEPGYDAAYLNVDRQISVPGEGIYGQGQFVVPKPNRRPPASAAAPGGAPATAPPSGGPKPLIPSAAQLPAAESSKNADLRTFIEDLEAIGRTYDPTITGPVQGRLGALRGATGIGSSEKEADFRARLASFENRLLNLRSGNAVTEPEAARIRAELPTAKDPDHVFRAKLARAIEASKQSLRNREAEFKERGYRGSSPAPAPAAAPSKPVPKILKITPVTGYGHGADQG